MPKLKGQNPDPDLTGYLRKRGSPLADHVPDIIRSANRYRIDPRLIVAISGGETSFATNGNGPKVHNAWGIGPGRSYGSWSEGIDATAKLLRQSYVGEGLTSIEAIQRKWAPVGAGNDPRNLNSNWIRTIGQFYSDLGGNPMNVTGGWRKQAAPKNLGMTPPKAGGVPAIEYTPQTDLIAQTALSNLASIARGEDPSKTLRSLVDATIQQTVTNAMAQRALDQPPKPKKNKSPDGGTYTYTRTNEQASSPEVGEAVQIAMRQIGKPYVWGTEGPKSFDCSGLIEYAFEQAGIKTPGRLTTWSMKNLGKSVKGSTLLPGDWVITNGGKHVVMYIGGGEVVAAPRSGTDVQVQKLADHKSGIVDVRRYP
jgi:cell wall-associated NlpC family hydrolase